MNLMGWIYTNTVNRYHAMYAGMWVMHYEATGLANARHIAAEHGYPDAYVYTHCEYLEIEEAGK